MGRTCAIEPIEPKRAVNGRALLMFALVSLLGSPNAHGGSEDASEVRGTPERVAPAARTSWGDLGRLSHVRKLADIEPPNGTNVYPDPIELEPLPGSPSVAIVPQQPAAQVVARAFTQVPRSGPMLQRTLPALGDPRTVVPPDTMGAVGPDHLMVMLNTEVRITDRAGTALGSDLTLAEFWSPLLAADVFDPRITYDPTTGRWYAVVAGSRRSSASALLFAVSQSSDPTEGWVFYRFDADVFNEVWADFPNLGFNGQWIALTANTFELGTDEFAGAMMLVVSKDTILGGGSAVVTRFRPGFDNVPTPVFFGFSLVPCTTFDPSERQLHIIDGFDFSSGGRNLLRLSLLRGSADDPRWLPAVGSTREGTGLFSVANPYSFQLPPGDQFGTSVQLRTGDARIQSAVLRNGTIWMTHAGGLPRNLPDRTGVFWYHLDPTALPNPIIQSGVLSGETGEHYIFPSIAVNSRQDVVIGFSFSSSRRFIGGAFAYRSLADPLGTMSPPQIFSPGLARYRRRPAGTVRWGDYSNTVVDPRNEIDFWTIQQRAFAESQRTPQADAWMTDWAKLTQRRVAVEVVPTDSRGTVPSFVDLADGAPAIVSAAEFIADSRRISALQWWGVALDSPGHVGPERDGGRREDASRAESAALSGPATLDATGDDRTEEPAGDDGPVEEPPFVLNDFCEEAIDIPEGVTRFKNVQANTDPLAVSCGPLRSGVWFQWRPIDDGEARIDTCGSFLNTLLAVYEGCDCPVTSERELACNDDAPIWSACPGSPRSAVRFPVRRGECYTIRLGGFQNAVAQGFLNIENVVCGDGEIAGDEECDPPDGITCDATCRRFDDVVDGWMIDVRPAPLADTAAPPIASWFCDPSVVDARPASGESCDGFQLVDYAVDLPTCCPVALRADPRTGEHAADEFGFMPQPDLTYALSIYAVTGARYVFDQGNRTCVLQKTGRAANVPIWRWATGAGTGEPPEGNAIYAIPRILNGRASATDWLPLEPTCGDPTPAFRLMTGDSAAPPP